MPDVEHLERIRVGVLDHHLFPDKRLAPAEVLTIREHALNSCSKKLPREKKVYKTRAGDLDTLDLHGLLGFKRCDNPLRNLARRLSELPCRHKRRVRCIISM